MCTVSYVPLSADSYIFSSNRDEAPSRSALELGKRNVRNSHIVFPKDEGANGSWIVLSSDKRLVCILNGAYIKHIRKTPYRLSRGIMAIEFFEFPNAQDFIENYNFIDIEPFTMIIIEDQALTELKWDGQKTYTTIKDPKKAHIWASSTLYNSEWKEKREKWFRKWLEEDIEKTVISTRNFHLTAGEGDLENDLVMNRNNVVATTSSSTIQKSFDGFIGDTLNLSSGQKLNLHIKF